MNTDERHPLVSVYCHDVPGGYSPYRLRDRDGNDIAEVNDFLDAQATRGLSPRTLRAYAYSLLNFWSWLTAEVGKKLPELRSRDVFEDYVRFQKADDTEFASATIDHRLAVACCLYHYHTGRDLPVGTASPSHPYHSSAASPSGYLYPARRRRRHDRPRSPRRVVVPLARREVRAFLESLLSWRDLAITSLMLLCGLRSREVIELLVENLDLAEAQLRVRGKGNKERVVPLPNEVIQFLRSYFELERPLRASETVFVSMKGKRRGQPMTPAGLRSLFRYHRKLSAVEKANPHRFRHTFGTEMAAAGVNLPTLMKLMGHGDINTTMRYVEIPTPDIHAEFRRVLKIRESLDEPEDDSEERHT